MKLHPKPAAALCGLAVLLCAAAPAAFLAVTDSTRFGRVFASAQPYTAAEPAGDDYYLLCQLARRAADHSEQTLQNRDFYLSGLNGLTAMNNDYDMHNEVLEILQGLADGGVLPQPWVDAAADWPDDEYYEEYGGGRYWLYYAYYTVDSLGFLTITRFGVEENEPYVVFTLTMDSRTGRVVSVWISAPEELETPGSEALQAWVRLNELDTLGDWAPPENTPYQNALYSARGQVLASCAVHADHPLYNRPEAERWYISLALNPIPPEGLPQNVPAA